LVQGKNCLVKYKYTRYFCNTYALLTHINPLNQNSKVYRSINSQDKAEEDTSLFNLLSR